MAAFGGCLLILVVGAFPNYTTYTSVVGQRTRGLALLRLVGARPEGIDTEMTGTQLARIVVGPGPATSVDDVLVLAGLYRVALEHLGVAARPKVTGQRGVQIWVPVRAGYSFDDTRAWVEKLSRAIGRTVPELVSWEWQKDRREGLARLDYTQNALNKTLVAPFSARPAPGAPVSVPIHWDELQDPELLPDRWTIRSVIDRVQDNGDPLAPLVGREQELPAL